MHNIYGDKIKTVKFGRSWLNGFKDRYHLSPVHNRFNVFSLTKSLMNSNPLLNSQESSTSHSLNMHLSQLQRSNQAHYQNHIIGATGNSVGKNINVSPDSASFNPLASTMNQSRNMYQHSANTSNHFYNTMANDLYDYPSHNGVSVSLNIHSNGPQSSHVIHPHRDSSTQSVHMNIHQPSSLHFQVPSQYQSRLPPQRVSQPHNNLLHSRTVLNDMEVDSTLLTHEYHPNEYDESDRSIRRDHIQILTNNNEYRLNNLNSENSAISSHNVNSMNDVDSNIQDISNILNNKRPRNEDNYINVINSSCRDITGVTEQGYHGNVSSHYPATLSTYLRNSSSNTMYDIPEN